MLKISFNNFDYIKIDRDGIDFIPTNLSVIIKKIIKCYTYLNVLIYKKSIGMLMQNFPGGFPICIIGMRGRISKYRKEIGLIYLPDGDNVYLVASQGGIDKHPIWYFNIKSNPNVDLIFRGKIQNMNVCELTNYEKRDVWSYLLRIYPDFDEYQARTDRNIAVFVCSQSDNKFKYKK